MRIKIPKKIKILLTDLYLNIAEKSQGSKLGIFSEIQIWRNHQFERAQKSYEKSRPPKGNDLEFLAFRFFELYNIEELNLLEKNIKKLITNYADEEKFYEFLNKVRNGTGRYSCYYVGVILKNPGSYFLSFFNYRFMRLPQEVSYVTVGLYQILPSFLIVTFDVILNVEY